MTWSIELIHHSQRYHFIPISTKVSYATSGKLRRIQGPFRSLRVFQDPNAPSRGARRDYVQSLPHHAEGSCKNLVQQLVHSRS